MFMYENFNKTENIREHDLNKNFAELFFYLILDCIGVLGGFLGNILIIGSIIFTKELHSVTSGIIVNLAIADFFLCTVVNGLTILGKYNKIYINRFF
jgi:hypothetical protein